MTDRYRVDHILNGGLRNAPTTWHPTEAAALAEEKRLHRSGVNRAVAWFCDLSDGEGDR